MTPAASDPYDWAADPQLSHGTPTEPDPWARAGWWTMVGLIVLVVVVAAATVGDLIGVAG